MGPFRFLRRYVLAPWLQVALGARELVYPPRCLACLAPAWGAGATPLCGNCAQAMPLPRRRCGRCARSLGPHEPGDQGCPACVGPDAVRDALGVAVPSARSAIASVVAAHTYVSTPRALALGLKFGGRFQVAKRFAADLIEVLVERGTPGDLVVSVPLSARRRRQRGYDQAALLARPVARGIGLPYAPRALRRRRDTQPQTRLSRTARLRAQRGAFVARPGQVAGRAVLLVDDVLTTGATARAAALALRRAGVVRVVVAVACRA